MLQRFSLLLLFGIAVGCWLRYSSQPLRKLSHWKQRSDLQLPMNRFATHKIEPTLAVEISSKGIWMEERLWLLALPLWLQERYESQAKRVRIPVGMLNGIVTAKSSTVSYLIPPLKRHAQTFASLAKKAARTKNPRGSQPLLGGLFKNTVKPSKYRFQGRSTLYFDRNMTLYNVGEVLFSLSQAGYRSYAFAACTRQKQDGQCEVKSFSLKDPLMFPSYLDVLTVSIHKNGFVVTEGKGHLLDSRKTRQKRKIPLWNGCYNYKALSLYLRKRVIAREKNPKRPVVLSMPSPRTSHRWNVVKSGASSTAASRPSTRGKSATRASSSSLLSLLNHHHFNPESSTVVIRGDADISYHVILSVFAATQQTPDGKELLPHRLLLVPQLTNKNIPKQRYTHTLR